MAWARLRMRARVGLSLVVGISILLAGNSAAAGHEVRRFEACGSRSLHGTCSRSVTFTKGHVGYLRATVDPPHDRLYARVTYLRPGAKRWGRGVDVRISASGRMHWVFTPTIESVDPDPWLFRFRVIGHGKSNRVTVLVEHDS